MKFVRCPHCLSPFRMQLSEEHVDSLGIECHNCSKIFCFHPDGTTDPDASGIPQHKIRSAQETSTRLNMSPHIESSENFSPLSSEHHESVVLIEEDNDFFRSQGYDQSELGEISAEHPQGSFDSLESLSPPPPPKKKKQIPSKEQLEKLNLMTPDQLAEKKQEEDATAILKSVPSQDKEETFETRAIAHATSLELELPSSPELEASNSGLDLDSLSSEELELPSEQSYASHEVIASIDGDELISMLTSDSLSELLEFGEEKEAGTTSSSGFSSEILIGTTGNEFTESINKKQPSQSFSDELWDIADSQEISDWDSEPDKAGNGDDDFWDGDSIDIPMFDELESEFEKDLRGESKDADDSLDETRNIVRREPPKKKKKSKVTLESFDPFEKVKESTNIEALDSPIFEPKEPKQEPDNRGLQKKTTNKKKRPSLAYTSQLKKEVEEKQELPEKAVLQNKKTGVNFSPPPPPPPEKDEPISPNIEESKPENQQKSREKEVPVFLSMGLQMFCFLLFVWFFSTILLSTQVGQIRPLGLFTYSIGALFPPSKVRITRSLAYTMKLKKKEFFIVRGTITNSTEKAIPFPTLEVYVKEKNRKTVLAQFSTEKQIPLIKMVQTKDNRSLLQTIEKAKRLKTLFRPGKKKEFLFLWHKDKDWKKLFVRISSEKMKK